MSERERLEAAVAAWRELAEEKVLAEFDAESRRSRAESPASTRKWMRSHAQARLAADMAAISRQAEEWLR
jgi:hypothetical protein